MAVRIGRVAAYVAATAIAAMLLWIALHGAVDRDGARADPAPVPTRSTAPDALDEPRVPADVASTRSHPTAEHVVVSADDAAPLPSARVVIVPASSAPESPAAESTAPALAVWPWPAPALLAREQQALDVDGEGRFELRRSDGEDLLGGTLWVSAPGHVARSFRLGGASRQLPPATIVLALGDAVRVRVVDSRGEPVPNAWVHQRFELAAGERAGLTADEIDARASYWFSVPTDHEGRAELADLGARQILDARTSNAGTIAWSGRAPADVELQLRPLARCVGTVTAADGAAHVMGGTVRVLAIGGGREHVLARVTVPADGRVAPFEVPVVDATDYAVEMRRPGWVPVRVLRPVPDPGGLLTFEITAVVGTRFPLLVLDDRGEPVPLAQASWAWQSGEEYVWLDAHTDSSGRCVGDGIPPGWLWLAVEKPGFVRVQQQLLHAGTFEPAYEVRLTRGGTLRGRVTSDGRPERKPTLVTRRVTGAREEPAVLHDVDADEHGAYVLEGLPIGPADVFAFSPNRPRTAARRVEIAVEEAAIADFALPAVGIVRGRVIDALTSQPVLGAQVQWWTTVDTARLRPWGTSARTDAEGVFQLPGATPEALQTFEVGAEGFAPALVHLGPSPKREIDAGVIGLARPQRVEVRVRLDAPADLDALTVSLRGVSPSEPRRVDADGQVTFAAQPPGDYELRLDHDVAWWWKAGFRLGPHAPARLDVDLRTRRELSIHVLDGPAARLPDDAVLRVRYAETSLGGAAVWQTRIGPSRRVAVGSLPAVRATLEVLSGDGITLGSLQLDGQEPGPSIDLRLGGTDARLRVVDAASQPIASALVEIHRVPSFAERVLESDALGLAHVTAFTDADVDVLLHHPAHGFAFHRGVRLRQYPLDLAIDPDAALHLRFVDGNVSLPGVSASIHEARSFGFQLAHLTSDAQGEARLERVPAGELECRVNHPGIWPARATVHATPEGGTQAVRLRRVGSVVLRVTRGGAPWAGALLRIRSVEDDVDVTTWMASSAIRADPPTGLTDAHGVLRLDGLPNGDYAWSIESGAAALLQGSVGVLPVREVEALIDVP